MLFRSAEVLVTDTFALDVHDAALRHVEDCRRYTQKLRGSRRHAYVPSAAHKLASFTDVMFSYQQGGIQMSHKVPH